MRALRTISVAGAVLVGSGGAGYYVVHPGDSLSGRAYSEFGDSLVTLTLVAEAPARITVPAGAFETLPLRGAAFRVYVTRVAPRRVVKGESLDGAFRFELVTP